MPDDERPKHKPRITLSAEARRLLGLLAEKTGSHPSRLLETAVYEKALRENVVLQHEDGPQDADKRLPTDEELMERLGSMRRFSPGEDGPTLEATLNTLWPLLEEAATPWPTRTRYRILPRAFQLARAVARVIGYYREELLHPHGSEVELKEGVEERRQALQSLVTRALSVAEKMEWEDDREHWDELRQRISLPMAELLEELGDPDAAEQYYQIAVAFGSDEWTSSLALQGLGAIWRSRDPWRAAYFYRWAARLSGPIPAMSYAELYCCLQEAGARDQITAEITECERQADLTFQDLQRLAAAKQALGMQHEADQLWTRCIKGMRDHPDNWVPGVWEAHVQSAREIRPRQDGRP